MPRIAFEDFTSGTTASYGDLVVTRDDLVAFAREFDDQPFHTDEEAARHTFVGTLIASGWHTCAMQMRMIADAWLLDSTSMGAPGIDAVRWLRPVRPGDRLRVRHTVLDTRASKSRPDMGLVRFRIETLNQADAPVLEQTNWIMFGRREPAPVTETPSAPAGNRPDRDAPAVASPAVPADPEDSAATDLYFEDLVPGRTSALGAVTFSAEDIVRYARRFDPQPFHVDPEAARRSHFGALSASGWHTAAGWMQRMVAYRERVAAAARARGREPAALGPSPGFTDLKWSKPVRAGDTITYASTITATRASASRPGWGLVFHHNTGVNQHGETVFAFDGCVFWQRRP